MTAKIQHFRTPMVLPVAGAITVGLFLLMRDLIAVPGVEREEVVELPPIEINFDVVDVEPDRTRRPELVEVVAPPPMPTVETPRSAAPDNPGLEGNFVLPPVEPPVVGSGDGPIRIDRNPSPTLRIEPVYPAREASRGNSGSCTVIFDITPQGRTTNIRALDCDSRAFEQATMNAVSHWHYNPQIENGEPILFRGATTRLDYRLDG